MDIHCEPARIYSEREVAASKDVKCHACREMIPRGFKYTRVGVLFDGEWTTHRRCPRCQAIHEHLRSLNGTYDEGWPRDRLDCGHGYKELHGDDPPEEIAALAFWLPGDEMEEQA